MDYIDTHYTYTYCRVFLKNIQTPTKTIPLNPYDPECVTVSICRDPASAWQPIFLLACLLHIGPLKGALELLQKTEHTIKYNIYSLYLNLGCLKFLRRVFPVVMLVLFLNFSFISKCCNVLNVYRLMVFFYFSFQLSLIDWYKTHNQITNVRC